MMTNKEYLTSTLSGFGVSDTDIEIILLKANMDADDDLDIDAADMAMYKRMSVVLKSTTQNVSEGGYSISWNIDGINLFYAALCDELGVENVLTSGPKIRDKSNIW